MAGSLSALRGQRITLGIRAVLERLEDLGPRTLARTMADIEREDLLTCAAVLERLTSALANRNARTG